MAGHSIDYDTIPGTEQLIGTLSLLVLQATAL